MAKPTEADTSLGWAAIALMGGAASLMAAFCPPFFWLMLAAVFFGLVGAMGKGSSYPDQNCGPGGPDAY